MGSKVDVIGLHGMCQDEGDSPGVLASSETRAQQPRTQAIHRALLHVGVSTAPVK